MIYLSLNSGLLLIIVSASSLTLVACEQQTSVSLITIADARNNPAKLIDNGEPGDSPGDILLFDQPLLDKDMKTIGTNSGSCLRTRVGHSLQCQWTLTFGDEIKTSGSIQVAGREYDNGTSNISIVGGTGKYSGISGEMRSTNNSDGTFTQVLHYKIGR